MAQTRKQRVLEEVRRKRQQRTIFSMVIVAVLIAIIGVGVWALSRNSNGSNFPFPCLAETTNIHVHPWLRIWIEQTPGNNVSVTIPSAVGILNPRISNGLASAGTCFEPLHTHDASGLIHIESGSTSDIYHLNDFFNVWKATPGYSTVTVQGFGSRPVEFNQTDILGFNQDASHKLLFLVDGQNSTAYGNLVLNQYDYCNSGLPPTSTPCYPTDSGQTGIANPYYGGGSYPYGTGHTIVIFYKAF